MKCFCNCYKIVFMTSLYMCKHKSMPNVCRIAKFQRLYYDPPSVMGEHFINS